MTREEMMQALIEKFGFENSITITFCAFAENSAVHDEQVKKAFEELMK